MTADRAEKRAAREFARKHDVPYTQALRVIRDARAKEQEAKQNG